MSKRKYIILQGDCLELMKGIPPGSVDMILADPPYGNINGIKLKGWDAGTTTWDTKIDTGSLFLEYERVLRKNGAIVLFSMCPYTSELRIGKYANVEFVYPLIWKKNHFANPLSTKKAPVSYFEDISVFYKVHDSDLRHPLREYSSDLLKFIGKSRADIISEIGQRADHFFRVDSMQFSLCTEATYKELVDRYAVDGMKGYKTYAECSEIEREFKRAFRRTFNLPDGKKFIGNILEFKKDPRGVHPTQKPVAMLEHLIQTYTNPGNLVLDNCMGSGSTGVACMNTGRRFIGMELDPGYFEIAKKRIEEAEEKGGVCSGRNQVHHIPPADHKEELPADSHQPKDGTALHHAECQVQRVRDHGGLVFEASAPSAHRVPCQRQVPVLYADQEADGPEQPLGSCDGPAGHFRDPGR